MHLLSGSSSASTRFATVFCGEEMKMLKEGTVPSTGNRYTPQSEWVVLASRIWTPTVQLFTYDDLGLPGRTHPDHGLASHWPALRVIWACFMHPPLFRWAMESLRLFGSALIDLAPKLFNLARRKNLTVAAALSDDRWMKGLQRINSSDEIDSFVDLWSKPQHIQLDHTPDSISWNWTASGSYWSHAQAPSECHLEAENGRKSSFLYLAASPKQASNCRQNSRPGQPTWRQMRPMRSDIESAAHLFCQCPFTAEMWFKLGASNPAIQQVNITSFNSIGKWRPHLAGGPKHTAVTGAYFAWHIWNERNSIFTNTASCPVSVGGGVVNDLQLIRLNVVEP